MGSESNSLETLTSAINLSPQYTHPPPHPPMWYSALHGNTWEQASDQGNPTPIVGRLNERKTQINKAGQIGGRALVLGDIFLMNRKRECVLLHC